MIKMSMNGVPVARRRLILRQDGATGSRMLFILVSGLFNAIFSIFGSEISPQGSKIRNSSYFLVMGHEFPIGTVFMVGCYLAVGFFLVVECSGGWVRCSPFPREAQNHRQGYFGRVQKQSNRA